MIWKNIDINKYNLSLGINSKYITIYVYQISDTTPKSHLFKGSVQFKKRNSMYCYYVTNDHFIDSSIKNHIKSTTLTCLIDENIAIKNNDELILSNSFLLNLL